MEESRRNLFEGLVNGDCDDLIQNYINNEDGANRSGKFDQLLLCMAAAFGRIKSLMILIQNDVEINIPNDSGETAFHSAVSCNQKETARILLEYGADDSIKLNKNLGDCDIFEYAQRHKFDEIADMILNKRAEKIDQKPVKKI